ncbi:Helix-turn-helix domain-containing protein [Variovorax sp. YR752]|uniref:helix-turn-helix domain-containing protein n=1 Tax=unclassified Variovorax TaxID=663243 RepID=UPI000BD564A1|nr:AraC family transcriptional regulator [Variovorax sp. YR752]SOE06278.1 Helix-turn-helix domain-containing protein [Variovorax sp. YR752]
MMPLASTFRPRAKAAPPESFASPSLETLETCATVHCEAADTLSDRRHDQRSLLEHELHLIGAMPARLRISSGPNEETHNFAPGTVVLLGPRLPRSLAFEHRAPAGSHSSGRVLRFSDEPLRRGMLLFPELGDVGPLLTRARVGVQFVGLGTGTLARLHRIETLHGLAQFSEFTALLSELAQWTNYRLLAGAVPTDGQDDEGRRALLIHKALDHIRDNYEQELSLAELSAIVGMREHAFSRSFRRATGQTFTDFVIGLRVSTACRLLVSTRQQVSSICYEVGFNNISNFNRHFRRIKGMTPGEFRTRPSSTGR